MSKAIPSLIWFSALAWGPGEAARAASAANVPTDACTSLPVNHAGATGDDVVYRNREYGFSLSPPPSWKGFRALACPWGGSDVGHHGEELTGRCS